MNDHDQLISEHLDGTLDGDGYRRLEAWLAADQRHRHRFVRLVMDHQALRQQAAKPASGSSATEHQRTAPRPRFGRVLLAAGLLAALGGWFLLRSPLPPTALPRILAAHAATLAGASATPGAKVPVGDRLATGPDGTLTLQWADGTFGELRPHSEVEIASGAGITLHLIRGSLALDVQPQPRSAPLRVCTAELETEVIGTRLEVASAPDETTVAVSVGAVRVHRPGEAGGTDVHAGHWVAAVPGQPLQPRPAGMPAGRLLRVGGGEIIPDLDALPPLQAGDVIELLPGTQWSLLNLPAVGTRLRPLVVRGSTSGRSRINASSAVVDGAHGKPRAAIQIGGGWTRIENLEILGARNGAHAAGIRIMPAPGHTTVLGCRITGNDIGVLADGGDRLVLDGCVITGNGSAARSGYTPNLSLASQASTVRDCVIENAPHGVNVSIQAGRAELIRNRIGGGSDGEIDVLSPRGDAAFILIGNLITGAPLQTGPVNHVRFIQIGNRATPYPGPIQLCNNTLLAGHPQAVLLSAPGSVIRLDNSICAGTSLIADASTRLDGGCNWLPPGQIPPGLRNPVGGADPGFVNPRHDWRLRADSPCLAAADPAQRWTDLDGIERSALPTADPPEVDGRPSAQRSPGPHVGACAPAP